MPASPTVGDGGPKGAGVDRWRGQVAWAGPRALSEPVVGCVGAEMSHVGRRSNATLRRRLVGFAVVGFAVVIVLVLFGLVLTSAR